MQAHSTFQLDHYNLVTQVAGSTSSALIARVGFESASWESIENRMYDYFIQDAISSTSLNN